MSAQDHVSPHQFKGIDWDESDRLMESTFHPQQLDAAKEAHPKSGWMVDKGEGRRLHRPPEGQDETPAVFDVRDHGDPQSPEYSSLKYMNPQPIRQEPVQHVYRGMSADEFSQAKQRGYIKSDQRGTIADWEGTNAGTEPGTAVSYLPYDKPSVIAKIAVKPEDKWFAIRSDSYVRTREAIPMDRVSAVSPTLYKGHDSKSFLSVETK